MWNCRKLIILKPHPFISSRPSVSLSMMCLGSLFKGRVLGQRYWRESTYRPLRPLAELSSLLRFAEAWFPPELSASRLLSALGGQHGLHDQSSSSQPGTRLSLCKLYITHVCQNKPTEGDSPVLHSMLIASVKTLHSAPDKGQLELRVETLGTDGTRTGMKVCLPITPSLSKSTASFF